MSWRWSFVVLAGVTLAVVGSGCASKATSMTELELVELVDGTKIEDWKGVGNGGFDAAGIGLVQEAREWQKESKVLEQQMNASGPVAVFSRSVDAELQKRGLSSPTETQREEVATEVMSWMPPADRVKLRAAIDANTSLADQKEKDGDVALAQLKKLGEEAAKIFGGAAGGKEWWQIAAEQTGPAAEAKKQIDALTEFFDAARELIRMYKARLGNLEKIAEAVAKAEGQAR